MRYHRALYNDAGLVSQNTELHPGLGADRTTVPPDGTTVVTCHYLAYDLNETTASWTVNGQAYSEPLVSGESSIEITATVAGTLEVSCNGDTITIEVQ